MCRPLLILSLPSFAGCYIHTGQEQKSLPLGFDLQGFGMVLYLLHAAYNMICISPCIDVSLRTVSRSDLMLEQITRNKAESHCLLKDLHYSQSLKKTYTLTLRREFALQSRCLVNYVTVM